MEQPMRSHTTAILAFVGVVCLLRPHPVTGHARLWEPPGRSTMWRRGFNTPANYNDNQLFCGGFQYQLRMGYKCGVCGDPYDSRVKDNEAGGKYAQGVLAATYTQGQEVTFQVDVTANHKGFFEFRLCPVNDPKKDVVQPDCLAANPVPLADGSGTQYKLTYYGSKMFDVRVRLPANVTCNYCVLQMRYHTGNSWGKRPDGYSCVGCGPQEEFYACSDIRILPASGFSSSSTGSSSTSGSGSSSSSGASPTSSSGSSTSSRSSSTSGSSSAGRRPTSGTSTNTGSTSSKTGGSATYPNGDRMVCEAKQPTPGLKTWCQRNCQMGYCPSTHCVCREEQYQHQSNRPAGCRAAGAYADVPGYDAWCLANCPGNCPPSMCTCD